MHDKLFIKGLAPSKGRSRKPRELVVFVDQIDAVEARDSETTEVLLKSGAVKVFEAPFKDVWGAVENQMQQAMLRQQEAMMQQMTPHSKIPMDHPSRGPDLPMDGEILSPEGQTH